MLMSPTSTLPEWFAHASEALHAGNVDGWMEIYAPDAVHEFPFAPEGGARRLTGRDAIAAYMGRLPGLMRFGSLSDVRVREAGDEFIIEATGHHRRVSDDMPRDLSYVWFITRRDGQVVHFRDYMNPLQLSSR
jgi:ketosteroid isomerase-like protein